MKHSDIVSGFVHTPFNWIYATGADRTAAVAFLTGDVNKTAVDLDTGEIWLLKAVDGSGNATWQPLASALFELPVRSAVVSSGAAVAGAHGPVDATSANLSRALPTGQPAGTLISVEKTDASTHTVSVTGNIRGVAAQTLTLQLQHEQVMFITDAAGSWWPIAGHKTLASLDGRFLKADGSNMLPAVVSDSLSSAPSADYAVIKESPLNVMWAEFGAKVDGSTDDSAALQAALNACAVHGGDVYIPPGTGPSIVLSQLVLPNENPGASYPKQKKIRIYGSGGWASGQQTSGVDGGSRLDLRYASGPKILTLGLGELEIDHLSLIDTAGDAQPFIWTTGTTLRLHNLFAQGSKVTSACNQDLVVLGGATTTQDGTLNAPFQGYTSVIREIAMQGMRRLVLGQYYANGNTIADNWIGHSCGTNLSGGAAIEFAGAPTNSTTTNFITANQMEMIGYVYGIKLSYALSNLLIGNSCADPTGGTTLAAVRFDVNAVYNLLIPGYVDGAIPNLYTEDASVTDTNTIFPFSQSSTVKFPTQTVSANVLSANVVSSPAIETTLSGTVIANEHLNSDRAILFQQDGTNRSSFHNMGRYWDGGDDGTGANMTIDSGPGGSTIFYKAAAHRLQSHAGADLVQIGLSTLGFFGKTPHAQVATPVTLADVIALLQAYGLSA